MKYTYDGGKEIPLKWFENDVGPDPRKKMTAQQRAAFDADVDRLEAEIRQRDGLPTAAPGTPSKRP